MANYTISKRPKKNGFVYYARVRQKESGIVTFSKSKTFHSKSAATSWAKQIVHKVERNIDDIALELVDATLADLITKYMEKKQASNKPLGRTSIGSLKQTLTYPIANMLVTKIQSKDIIEYASQRKSSVHKPSASTVSVDISCIRKVLKIAKSLFGINTTDKAIVEAYPALHDLKLVARSGKRERRLKTNEFQLIHEHLKQKESHHCCIIPYSDLFELSILTCCRVGELCSLRWADLNFLNKTILVRDRKNPNGSFGNNSLLPLLSNSLEIIQRQPKIDERIFPVKSKTVTSGFRKTLKKLGIEDLRYHDLRREGASRLIEQGYSLEETARVTGHRDLKLGMHEH